MFLKRLEFIGFKSFATRTVVDLSPGIAVVVGPNGSGKSNIADAIRWVLGEQSAKAVRARKPEEVIFAGSDGRQPLGMAEVALIFDNSDGGLPLAFDEVKVSRRLYRSGESEYLLNNARVRLRDVTHQLLQVRLDPDSYCVIGQGSVDELILQRPDERRQVFENAADIRQHQIRLHDTRNKLAATDANLTRVRDVIAELGPHVRRLKGQADRAARAETMGSELRSLSLTYYRWRAGALRAEIRLAEAALLEIEEAVKIAEQRSAEAELQRNQGERAVVDAEKRLAVLRPRADALREQSLASERALALARERAKALSEQQPSVAVSLAESEERLDRLERDVVSQRSALADLAEQPNGGEDRAAVRQRFQESEGVVAALDRDAQALRLQRAGAEGRIGEMEREVARGEQRLRELEAERAVDAARAADRLARLEEVRSRAEVLAKQRLKLDEAAAEARRQCSEAEARLGTTAAALTQARDEEQATQKRLDRLQGTLDALGLTGADQARATLPGEWRDVLADLPVLGVAGEVAARVGPLDGLLRGYLQRIVVVREDASAREAHQRLARLLGPGASAWAVLSLEGLLLPASAEHQIEAADAGQGSTLAHWRERLAELERERARVMADRERAEKVRVEAEELRDREERTVSTLRQAAMEAESAQRNAQGLEATAAREGAALHADHDRASRASQLRDAEREAQVQGGSRARTRLEQSREERDVASRALADHEERLARAREASNVLRVKLAQVEEAAAVRSAELRTKQQLLERMELEIREADASRQRLRQQQSQLSAQVEAMATQQSEHEAAARLAREALGPAEATLAEAEAARTQADGERRAAEAKLAPLRAAERVEHERREHARLRAQRAQDEMHRLEQEVEEAPEGDDEDAVTAAWASQLRLALTESEVATELQEGPDLEAMRRRMATLRRELRLVGGVSGAVMQEFGELSERHAFLTQQAEDLGLAMEELRGGASELETYMRGRFSEVFESVNAAFQACFHMLFGGGEARLVLTEPGDVLETGIDVVARPPGKKLQGLVSLSGGERALTIVALLFGLLKVNPTPFCVLDEVDAALDEANVRRFAQLLAEFAPAIQFLVVTHNRATMEMADALYGVTMDANGVSRILSLEPHAAAAV